MTAERRVRALVAAANRVARDESVVAALVGPLSRAGVELALREHLELTPTDGEIAQLLANAPPETERATVILASNVFVGALRAAAVAAASAPHVELRPSRREPTFAEALVTAVGEDWLTLSSARELRTTRGAVHVYGRERTVQVVKAAVPADVAIYVHGPGFSAAYVDGDPIEAARLVAADVVPFDQRGCLSPRVTFVDGDATAFAQALDRELARAIPRGALEDEERAAWRRYLDTWTVAGATVHAGAAHAVVLAGAFSLAPVGRAMHVVPSTRAAMLETLTPCADRLVALAGTPSPFAHVRQAPLGRLQKPPFDGPVDLRALAPRH